MRAPDRETIMSKHLLSAFTLALGLTALAPETARAEGGDFLGAYVLIGAGGVAALTVNILPIIAETQKDETGRMPGGWLATQYIAGGLDLAAGGLILALSNAEGSGPAVAAAPLGFGVLWTTLAIINSVKRKRRTETARARSSPRGLKALRPFAVPTRVRDGLVAGFGLSF